MIVGLLMLTAAGTYKGFGLTSQRFCPLSFAAVLHLFMGLRHHRTALDPLILAVLSTRLGPSGEVLKNSTKRLRVNAPLTL